MTRCLRAVFNTNVIIAALRTENPSSPTAELLRRWVNDEFELIYCAALRDEYVEKFSERRIDPDRAIEFLTRLNRAGILVVVNADQIAPVVVQDADDDLPLACAQIGGATHLVSYDQHYAFLEGEYRDVKIVDGLHFLYLVRGDKI